MGMKSSVLIMPFWWRDEQFWCVRGDNSGMPSPLWFFGSEAAAMAFFDHMVEQYRYWQSCQNFIGEITPWEDEDE